MRIYPSDDGGAAFVRIERGADLLRSLNEAAGELGFDAATLQLLGAAERLAVAFYDQSEKRYVEHVRDAPHEVTGGVGNVSLKDGKAFVHIHLVGTAADGTTTAGHLVEGTRVFLIEAYFRRLDGPAPARQLDEDLGLPVWPL